MYQLVKNTTELQLIIELAVEGLRLRRFLPSFTPLSATELLQKFRNDRKNWETLSPKRIGWIPLERGEYQLLHEGVFAHGLLDMYGEFRGVELNLISENERQLQEKDGSNRLKSRPFGQFGPFGRIPPSGHEDREERPWLRYNDLGVKILDYFIDVSQDLFVFIREKTDDRLVAFS